MESGGGARIRTANPSEKSSVAPSSVAFDARSSLAPDLIRGAFSRRGAALMERGVTKKIKIMIFSKKLDKFTGFFDKYLKNISLANGCNQKSYHINLSVLHLDLAAKKVFCLPRISPHLPAFAGAGVRVHRPGRERPPG